MDRVGLIKELRKYQMSASVFGVKKELYATACLDYKDSLKAVVYKAASGGGSSHGDSVSGICLAYEKAELGMLNAMWHSVSDMRRAVTQNGIQVLQMQFIRILHIWNSIIRIMS